MAAQMGELAYTYVQTSDETIDMSMEGEQPGNANVYSRRESAEKARSVA